MNREMLDKTKSAVNLCRVKLENLKSRLNKSNEANIVYNRVLIEKAVLEHDMKKNPFGFFDNIKRIFTKEEKRICDTKHQRM